MMHPSAAMKHHHQSPPMLSMPNTTSPAPSPSNVSPGAHTGRPPMWTKSAQRKMIRLYTYTTLPLNKILDVIYSHSANAPGYVVNTSFPPISNFP